MANIRGSGLVERLWDTFRVDALSDEQAVKLLPALAEAARADRRTAARFVPPRTGILEETAARRHQFVFGRRGVGQSTLLRKSVSVCVCITLDALDEYASLGE